MTCSQTEKVSLLMDGELPATEIATVRAHLHECAECTAAHEAFLSLRSQISDYSPARAPVVTNAALAKLLNSSTGSPDPIPGWRERLVAAFAFDRSFNPRFAAALALLVVAFTAGAIALLRRQSNGQVATNQQSNPTALSQEKVTDDSKAQNPKPAARQKPPAETNKDGVKAKPSQTPARTPGQKRRRPDSVPSYSGIEGNVALNAEPLDHSQIELLTARHLEQSEVLLRAFRNVRNDQRGRAEVNYERERAQKLLYQNMLVRREADASGDVQVATLLGSLEPILLDIANLRNKPRNEEVTDIKDRMERKNLVPLLQINSAAVARAYD